MYMRLLTPEFDCSSLRIPTAATALVKRQLLGSQIDAPVDIATNFGTSIAVYPTSRACNLSEVEHLSLNQFSTDLQRFLPTAASLQIQNRTCCTATEIALGKQTRPRYKVFQTMAAARLFVFIVCYSSSF